MKKKSTSRKLNKIIVNKIIINKDIGIKYDRANRD